VIRLLFAKALFIISIFGLIVTLVFELVFETGGDMIRMLLMGWGVLGMIGFFAYRYLRMSGTPMLSAQVKVERKRVERKGVFAIAYHVEIRLPNRKKIWLNVSKKQYKALLENDIVDLVYKDYRCVSIKGSADKSPIINTDYYPANADISKLMEMDARMTSKKRR